MARLVGQLNLVARLCKNYVNDFLPSVGISLVSIL